MDINNIETQERSGMYDERWTDVTVCNKVALVMVAQMATDMATRWGLVAALPDGEDSAGRQKIRAQEPGELAKAACDTAAALWKEFEARDWLVAIPMPRKREKPVKEEGVVR